MSPKRNETDELFEKLRRSMNAAEERHALRRIVAHLQFKLRQSMERTNAADRKARRLSKLVDLHRDVAREYSDEIKRLAAIIKAFEVAQILPPSRVRGA